MWKGSYGDFNIVEAYVDSCMYIISNLGLTFNVSNYERIIVARGFVTNGSLIPPTDIVSEIIPPLVGSSTYTYNYIENLEEGQDYTFYAYSQAVKNKWYPDGIHGQYFLLGEDTIYTEREPEYGEYEVGKGFAYGATKFLLDTDHPFMLHLGVTNKSNNHISVEWTEQEKIKVFGLPEDRALANRLHNSKYDFSGSDYSQIRRSDLVVGWYDRVGEVSLLEQGRAMRLWGREDVLLRNIYNYRASDYYKFIDCIIQGVLLCLRLEPLPVETRNIDITVRFIDVDRGRDRLVDDSRRGDIREFLKRLKLV